MRGWISSVHGRGPKQTDLPYIRLEVNVIGNSSNGQGPRLQTAERPANIRMQVRAPGIPNHWRPALCGEDDVGIEAKVCGH